MTPEQNEFFTRGRLFQMYEIRRVLGLDIVQLEEWVSAEQQVADLEEEFRNGGKA